MSSRKASIAIMAILALVLAACGDTATTTTGDGAATTTTSGGATTTEAGDTTTTGGDGGDGEPIVVGASLPLTGEFSIAGSKHAAGYEFCVDEINARGGLLGRDVELIVEDNRSDPEVVVSQTERFINVENVDVLFGTFSSLLTFPASAVAQQNGMVYPVPSGGALRLWERGFDNMFYFQQKPAEFTGESVVNLLDYYQGEGIVDDAPTTAAVVNADDFFAQAIANGFVGGEVTIPDSDVVVDLAPGFLADAGIDLVFEEVWPIGYTDWLTLANSIRSSGAELLAIASASPDEVISLVRALQTVDYNPKAIYASQGAQTEFAEALEGAENGIFIHSVWAPTANFEGLLAGETYTNQDFIDGFTEANGAPPDEDEAIPFAVCQGMEQAIIGAGTTDNAALIEWLHGRSEDDPVETIMGDFSWDDRGLPTGRDYLVVQWQEGTLEFVFPVGEFPGTVDFVFPKPEWQ